MAAARKTKILAHRLAHDLATRVQDAGNYGGVELRRVPLYRGRTVHHRDAGHADVVLHGDALAREGPRIRPLDRALPVPGVQGVLLGLGPVTARAWVLDRRRLYLGQLFELLVIVGDDGLYEAVVGLELGFIEVQVVVVRDLLQLLDGRGSRWHLAFLSSLLP